MSLKDQNYYWRKTSLIDYKSVIFNFLLSNSAAMRLNPLNLKLFYSYLSTSSSSSSNNSFLTYNILDLAAKYNYLNT